MFSVVFSPLFSVINVLFPSLDGYMANVVSFINYSSTYVLNACDFVLLPRSYVIMLLDYFLIKYSIFLAIQTVKFTMMVYEKLKP